MCIDGGVCIVIALGIDTDGRKRLLGLREGATETAAPGPCLKSCSKAVLFQTVDPAGGG